MISPRQSQTTFPFALETVSLSHRYGKQTALRSVSLRLAMAKTLALVGANGAGKTTLFNLLTGLFYPQQGQVRVLGFDMAHAPRRALASVGVVFQQRAADLDLSVRQNLRYHAALHGIGKREADSRIAVESRRLGIADKLACPAGELSGGELRRMEIARALLHCPSLLLLDEPTAGLDARARLEVLRHLRALATEKICAVCFSTHLFDEVEADDETAVLHCGGLAAQGTLRHLLTLEKCADLRELFFAVTAQKNPDRQ